MEEVEKSKTSLFSCMETNKNKDYKVENVVGNVVGFEM